mmetsp:Transcript_68348/g.149198  ORF Transcript_68348/g.149198 Transcript_68348/m.149198 type:complete len:642 (+) Transcript_68348:74-1999(+)
MTPAPAASVAASIPSCLSGCSRREDGAPQQQTRRRREGQPLHSASSSSSSATRLGLLQRMLVGPLLLNSCLAPLHFGLAASAFSATAAAASAAPSAPDGSSSAVDRSALLFPDDGLPAAPVGENIPACWQTFSCCEGSEVTLSSDMWLLVKSWYSQYHLRELLDSTPRMLERHYTFYNLFKRLQGSQAWQAWAADCYFGVIGILLNALPAIEFEDGLSAAQNTFMGVMDMFQQNNQTEKANWTLPMEPLSLQFPFFLGLRPNGCHGSKLKVFVYETGSFSSGSLFCSAGQWGVEVAIHRYFSSSACRTSDPNEADFFLVPDYRACHYHLAPTYQQKGLTRLEGDDYHSALIRNHKDKYRKGDEADVTFRKLLAQLPHLKDKQGMDHIFVFSDQGFIVNFTHTFPSWRDEIPHAVFMTTEGFTPGCGPSCFSPWKDFAIPGHIDPERMAAIRNYSLPSNERTLLFNFHGRLPVNHGYYENVTVRRRLLDFADLPNVSVGGFIEEYFEVMGMSHFCIVPEGTSSWTNHLYESFFAGCIPIIISDRFVLPFQEVIPWNEVSIRWPQEELGLELYAYISDLVQNHAPVVAEMKRKVDEAACWFDFYRFEEPCSPYAAILKTLEQRKAAFPRYLYPEWWLPVRLGA